MEIKTNKTTLQVIVLAAVIIIGSIWIHNIRSGIEYADFECPMCESNEVLKLHSENGTTNYECADCHTKYATYDSYDD